MANEITSRCQLSVTKSGSTTTGDSTKQITLTGNGQYANVQSFTASTTTGTQITFSAGIVAEGIGYMWFKNLHATNYIEISTANTDQTAFDNARFAKLLAGETAMFRTHKGVGVDPTLYARANTATIPLQVVAVGT